MFKWNTKYIWAIQSDTNSITDELMRNEKHRTQKDNQRWLWGTIRLKHIIYSHMNTDFVWLWLWLSYEIDKKNQKINWKKNEKLSAFVLSNLKTYDLKSWENSELKSWDSWPEKAPKETETRWKPETTSFDGRAKHFWIDCPKNDEFR